jgi:hypothetical protein
MQDPAVSDGYLVTLNGYDNRIYCFGKGPSATTVSAPQTVPTLGSSVMIKGTVTDQSAGAKDTPTIADVSMTAWMEYLYMQKPIPADAKGVGVSLDTIDPNGNFVHIGTVTSDLTGAYGYAFTPEVPGTYQIIATFAGSASYGSSSATTYLAVLCYSERKSTVATVAVVPRDSIFSFFLFLRPLRAFGKPLLTLT